MQPQLNRITRLARAGALEQAWAAFRDGGFLAAAPDDPDVLTVHGRLLKDRAARESGPARDALLDRAIDAYHRASDRSRATYPLINAATLAFLAGRRDQAHRLAQETIALLDSLSYAPETPYWLAATRAEALLLLNRTAEAESVLAQAIRQQPEAWEDHAVTLRQFAAILDAMGASSDWLDRYRPPLCLHFDGILGIAETDTETPRLIRERLAALRPGSAVGALASGADILIAEAVLEIGGYLHVVLPCPPDRFRATSVSPFGAGWTARFDRLLDAATTVVVLDDRQPPSDAAVALAREAAMGFALHEKARLQSPACALRVRVAGERDTPAEDACWARLGLPFDPIWTQRSDRKRRALPPHGEARALLAVPSRLAPALMRLGAPVPVAPCDDAVRQEDERAVFALTDPAEGARLATTLLAGHPDARLALDYRAFVPDAAHTPPYWDRACALAGAGPEGGVALSEAAALVLALRAPQDNVQPIGDARLPTGDLPLYALFPRG